MNYCKLLFFILFCFVSLQAIEEKESSDASFKKVLQLVEIAGRSKKEAYFNPTEDGNAQCIRCGFIAEIGIEGTTQEDACLNHIEKCLGSKAVGVKKVNRSSSSSSDCEKISLASPLESPLCKRRFSLRISESSLSKVESDFLED